MTYRLQKKYRSQIHIVDDGRKNWRVAGMSSTQTAAMRENILSAGAGGAIHSENSTRPMRKGYWISNKRHWCFCKSRMPSQKLKEVRKLVMSSTPGCVDLDLDLARRRPAGERLGRRFKKARLTCSVRRVGSLGLPEYDTEWSFMVVRCSREKLREK